MQRRPQSVPTRGIRKIESEMNPPSNNQPAETSGVPRMIRPGTAPVLRTLGDSLEVRTRGWCKQEL